MRRHKVGGSLLSAVLGRRQILAGTILALLAGGWLLFRPGDALATLSSVVESAWFPVVLIIGYGVRGVLGWPVTVLSALVGYRYGVIIGFPIALVGALATTSLTWAIARRTGVEKGWIGRVATGGRRYFDTAGPIRGVAAARLAPTPAVAVSAAAGIASVPWPAFAAGTIIGVLPWTVGAVTVGASLESVAAAGTVSADPQLIIGCALLAVLLLAQPAYRTAINRGWLKD